jgi:hypothetical protein
MQQYFKFKPILLKLLISFSYMKKSLKICNVQSIMEIISTKPKDFKKTYDGVILECNICISLHKIPSHGIKVCILQGQIR